MAAMATKQMFAVVDAAAASQQPYPYVYVSSDGSVRELHAAERKYLETPFSPMDGARPYVKVDYQSKIGGESIEGFCPRAKIPTGIVIAAPPTENPNPPMTKADIVESLRKKMSGFDVTEMPAGTLIAKRKLKK